MIESLVITLREGIEAALVVGIILAYLSKTGKSYLNGRVYSGLVAAIVASIAIAVLLASALTVFSTLTASVLERRREIGLMKALGARNRQIMLVFLAEAWLIGVVAGLLGTVLGIGLAQMIGQTVFDTFLSFGFVVIPVVFAVALLVTTLASLWPVRNALVVEPITALRSE